MKKIFYIALCAIFFASCSDKVYEEINTDPTKADNVNPSSQLTYAALQMYGDMNFVDVYRLYTYAFTQHLMGCWNTSNYGGQHRSDDQEMARPWNNLYPAAIRNLTDAIEKTKDDTIKVNLNAALHIFRVYVGGVLSDFYGDVPYSEAGLGYISGITQPKYDTQEELYRGFFEELKAAEAQFDTRAEGLLSDPVFDGNLEGWKTFSRSLRLRYAMRISDKLPELAETEFKAALADGVMGSAAENACVKHMNVSFNFGQEAYKDFRGNALSKYFYGNDPASNPTYICATFWKQLYDNNDPRTTRLFRFYIDDYMSVTSPEGRIDVTDAILATQAAYPATSVISTVVPGDFSWDDWPSYENSVPVGSALRDRIAEIQIAHPDFDPSNGLSGTRWLKAKLATNFMRSDNPGVLMTYAEVCFLRAEAAAVHPDWGTGDDAKAMYEAGIRAAMDFLAQYYDCSPITDDEYAAYIAQPGIAFAGDQETCKQQINTQAWILHFHNPSEAWANVRRSDYPALQNPSDAHNKIIDGPDIPVRLCYPLKEKTNSEKAYNEAVSRVPGKYDWHARVWWDVK